MPPVVEDNPHDAIGAYHLHVEYDDEDSQKVKREENKSFDMIGCCCSHIKNNKEHISQSDDLKNCLSMTPIEEELDENKLNESLPMNTSYPIFEPFSFEAPDTVLVTNIDQ